MCFLTSYETWTACQKPISNLRYFDRANLNLLLIYITSSQKPCFLHFMKRYILSDSHSLDEKILVHLKHIYCTYTYTCPHKTAFRIIYPVTLLCKSNSQKSIKSLKSLIFFQYIKFYKLKQKPSNTLLSRALQVWIDKKKSLILFILTHWHLVCGLGFIMQHIKRSTENLTLIYFFK